VRRAGGKSRCTAVLPTGVSRARYFNPGTGRFWTMDTDEGDNEDPLSLHKYLYGRDNPVNRIDPSGHDDLVDLVSTMAIDSGLASMVMPAVINAGGHAIASLIPQSVDQKLSSTVPDAVEFGGSVSGNLPIGKYPVGITGGGGIECLVSPKTFGAALYGYAGGGLSFGANTASAGVQGTFGFVFDTLTSQNYTKHFITLSLPYMALPTNVRTKIDGFMASGFGATVGGSSQEFIQEAQSLGVQFSGVVNKSSVNVFWDPLGGGSCGVTFSKGIASTPNASSNFTATYSYYWQLLPHDDQAVSFR